MFPFTVSIEILTAVFEDPIEHWDFDDLTAPYWRLYANYGTGASISANDEETSLLPGWAYLIPPETSFATRISDPVGHFYIHFLAKEPFDSVEPGVYSFRLTDDERRTRDRLAALYRSRRVNGVLPPTASIPARQAAAVVCSAVALIAGALARIDQASIRVPAHDPRIERVIRLIDESRDKPPSIADLASVAGLHPDSLGRLFRQETGTTPAKWCLKRRIDRACVLLAHGEKSIKEIADACGFKDRDYFTTAFARLRGISPARWRRERSGRA